MVESTIQNSVPGLFRTHLLPRACRPSQGVPTLSDCLPPCTSRPPRCDLPALRMLSQIPMLFAWRYVGPLPPLRWSPPTMVLVQAPARWLAYTTGRGCTLLAGHWFVTCSECLDGPLTPCSECPDGLLTPCSECLDGLLTPCPDFLRMS